VSKSEYDAVIVGSGPNGLAAGICLAQKRYSVLVLEAKPTIGGGARSMELTLPGFIHDPCSTIHPLGAGSPFFKTLPLADYGLEMLQPTASLAHPFDEGSLAELKLSVKETADSFGPDRESYMRSMSSFVERWDDLAPDILAPLHFPRHPFLMASFGLDAMRTARGFAEGRFREEQTRAIFAGCAAHSMIPLESWASASFGLVLMILAHSAGWGFPRGGTQKITDALAAYFTSLGGEIRTNSPVADLDELPSSRAVLFDLTPRQVVSIAKHRIPDSYRRRLDKYQYGAGVFKIDYALSEAAPWKNRECMNAATVHLGASLDEISVSESDVARGLVSDRPFVIYVQTSIFDPTRAPEGKQIGWAYCHVPNGFTEDMTERIEDQIERFAPGFRDCILARAAMSPAAMQEYNANYIGGDINGGAAYLSQLFTRPVARLDPYRIPETNMFICSSSTPPGGGVHGMCGFHAARSVISELEK
jgi:phytoene dehydrogenase-like protein